MRVLQVFLTISIVFEAVECRCSPSSEFTIVDANGQRRCEKCLKCPPGQGLPVQCGSNIANGTDTDCKSCKANETFSEGYDSSSCKSCNLCGLKKILQHCTPRRNRVCANSCPPGYFLDKHDDCTKYYFCCENVPEHDRLQKCKDLGMPRRLQCLKTKQNKRCKTLFHQTSVKMSVTITPITTNVSVAEKDKEPLTMISKGTITPKTSGHSSTWSRQPLTTNTSESLATSNKPTLPVEKALKPSPPTGDRTDKTGLTTVDSVLVSLVFAIVLVVIMVLICKYKTSVGFTGVKRDDIDISIIPEDVDLSDLPYDVEKSICKLDTRTKGVSDWYNVGRHLGVPSNDMKPLEMEYNRQGGSPAKVLIEILQTKYCLKLRKCVIALQKEGRNDIAKEICSFYEKNEYVTNDRFTSSSTVESYV